MNTGRERNCVIDASRTQHSRSNIAHSIALVFIACIFLVAAASCSKHRTARVPSPPTPARVGKTEKGLASWYGIPYHGRRAASGEVFDMEQLTAAHRTLPFQTWVMVTNLDNGKKVDVRITDRGPFVDNCIIDLSKAAAREIDMLGSGTARVKLKVIKPPKHIATIVSPIPPALPTPSVVAPARDPVPTSVPSEIPSETPQLPASPPVLSTPDLVLPAPSPVSIPTIYSIQAGAFSSQRNAELLRDRLQQKLQARALESTLVRIERRIGRSGAPLWFVLVGDRLSGESAAALLVTVKEISGDGVVVVQR